MVALREKKPNNINKTGGVDGACYWASRVFFPSNLVYSIPEKKKKNVNMFCFHQ